jgi:hypothetical protein
MDTRKMTKEQFIDTLNFSLQNFALDDIKRASNGNSKMGAFILASCFIDVLARYRYGFVGVKGKIKRREQPEGTASLHYKAFVAEYLSDYIADDLYESLRCNLVHSYTEGGKYYFTDAEKAGLHLENKDGRTLLNLEHFIGDITKAYDKLIDDIKNDKEILENALFKFNTDGTLGLVDLENRESDKTTERSQCVESLTVTGHTCNSKVFITSDK